MENKHTYTEYQFPDGDTIKCTVAFKFLLKLREKNKKIYDKLNNGLLMGVKEMTEAAYVLYGAYLCACYAGENGGEENIMSESDFIEKLDDDVLDVMLAGNSLLNKKKKLAFRDAFAKKTKPTRNRIKPPKFTLEDIEDFYTFYVLILGIPEDIFWNADYSFVTSVAENKRAYDGWLSSATEEAREKARRDRK